MKTEQRPEKATPLRQTASSFAVAACSGQAKTLARGLLLLIALMAGVTCRVVAQSKPFPQQLTYPGCIKPNHVTQATLNSDVLAYYTYWRGKYLKQSGVNAAHYYVAAGSTGGSASAVSQSEAHGYGMVITALMAGADPNAKTYYDGLYRMYDTHRSVNNRNLMQWQLFADERNANIGSATDGDMDIAYSLLLAHYQWGSAGSINYLDAAQKMITNGLEASCVYSTLRLGLSDDRTSDLLSTRPSDWMFDHMRAFRAHTNRAIWDQLATNLYSVYNTIYTNHSANTGLISDFVMYDPPRPAPPGQPQADEGSTTGDYYYNASRVPLRLVMDFAHYGTAAPKPFLSKMVAWAKTTTGNDPTRFQAGYKLSGTPLSGANYPSAVFISPMIAAGVIDPANQQWLNSGWNYMKAAKEGYFEDSYNMLCVLFVSGNWWVPVPTTTPNQAPSVSLTSPAANASFTAPATVTLRANATDAGGTVAKVEFYQGSTKLGEDTSSPYTFDWTNVAAGSYSLTAKATDNQGATATSAAVNVTVGAAPVAHAIPGTIEAESYAAMSGVDTEPTTDAGGGRNVDWFETGDWVEYAVNVAAAGSYTVGFRVASATGGATLQLRNAAGASLGSVSVENTGGWQNWVTRTATVALPAGVQRLRVHATASTGCNLNWLSFAAGGPANTPPTVSFTAPANGASFTAPASITLTADAADANGSVAKVEFFQGTTKLGEAASAPYNFAWTGVPAGSYSLTAKATDNLGATTVSSATNVTVKAASGGGSCATPAWTATAVYVNGNQASRNGNVYSAKWWTQGDDPTTNSCQDCVWKLVGPCGGARQQLSASAAVSVYPNPAAARNQLTVDLGAVRPEVQLVLTDLRGAKLTAHSYHNVRLAQLTLPAVPKGVFLLRIVAGQDVAVQRVVVD